MKEAMARACFDVASMCKGASHRVTGTARPKTYPMIFRGEVSDSSDLPICSVAATPMAINAFPQLSLAILARQFPRQRVPERRRSFHPFAARREACPTFLLRSDEPQGSILRQAENP